MSIREKIVINAFINCVKSGQRTVDYAITLFEDNERYGYLTDEAKNIFYLEFGIYDKIASENNPEMVDEEE